MKTLDRNSSTPLHVQLRDALLANIEGSSYAPGAAFSTEREIAATYHVSRTTIREAIQELVRLGFLTRQQGKGTFVARSRTPFDATRLSSFTEDMTREGRVAGARVLALTRVPPPEDVAEHFGPQVREVWRIARLRTANDEPIAIQTSYVRADTFAFTVEELTNASLYAVLCERYGVGTVGADEVISAQVATGAEAELLAVEPGCPLLCVDRFAYSQTGDPIEAVHIKYRADRYRFYVHQHRGG